MTDASEPEHEPALEREPEHEPESVVARTRGKTRSRAIRVHQAALATQFVLGGYLWLVPDELFFVGTQIAVLLHVVTALIWLPFFTVWLVRHVLRPAPRALRRLTDRGRTKGSLNAMFLVAVAAALASGAWLIVRSQGMPAAWVHTAAGGLVVALLVAHYALEARRHLTRTAIAVGGVVVVALGLRLVAPALERAPDHSGEAILAPDAAYDDAAWCGSCHEAIYEEWRLSAHGRALVDRNIRDELEEEAAERPLNLHGNLATLAALAEGDPEITAALAQQRFDPCVHCHAPSSFYGDSDQPILEATDSAGDGITCSFCHTLQGVDASGVADMSTDRLRALAADGAFDSPAKINELFARNVPRYLSKPQRVRRYLGQHADNRLARAVGDYLIRWRPEVHRRDYRPRFLSTSEACQACHGSGGHADVLFHQTYPDWARSRYAGSVDCQDCHMVREFTGEAHREPGRLVPWGPARPSRRNHQLLGGNLSHLAADADPDYVAAQRRVRARALELWVDDVSGEGTTQLEVAVGLRNLAVGHDFPGRETPVRFAWVHVEAQDARGEVLGTTPLWSGHPDEEPVPDNVVAYYRKVQGFDIAWDTSLPPDGERVDTVVITVPEGSAVAQVVAYLHANTDPEPAIVVSREL